jgi:outer membrane receptor protein involved in Fe transport
MPLINMPAVAQVDQSTNASTTISTGATTVKSSVESKDSSSGSDKSGLGEIIVTAQKRTENAQNVPISISVLGGRDLDKSSFEGVTDALNSVPGVAAIVGFQGGSTQLSVRGVSAAGPLFNASSPIGYYLDSVPFGLVRTAIAPDANAYDLDRVEVLRGPQGTLYGASALNGVVRVLTKDADLNDFDFKARTSVSTTDGGGENYRGDMAVNLPIIEGKLAARVVVGDASSSGWIDSPNKNHVNDEDVKNLRLKINALPTEDLSIGLSVWHSQTDDGAPPISLDNRTITAREPEPIATDYTAYGLKVGYDFSNLTISSSTSYLAYQNDGDLDESVNGLVVHGVPASLRTDLTSKVLSEEFLVNSKLHGPFKWSTGAFYRNARDRDYQTLENILPAPVDFSDTSKSWAVFGELGQRFFEDQLEWTLGLRHFHDQVGTRQNGEYGKPAGTPLLQQGATSNATTPRAVLSWFPSADLTLYASYSQGFRSGFPQDFLTVISAPNFPPLKPDKLINYEVGAKGSFLDRRISFDTALYYIDWHDVQQPLGIPYKGATIVAPVNGNTASGVGIDFSVTAQPIEGWQAGLNFSWNNLSVDSEVISQGTLLFHKGDRLNYSPEYTMGASTQYAVAFGGSGFKGRFSASANYTSEMDSRAITGHRLSVYAGNSILIDRASFSVDAPDHWSATLFADNINNAHGAVLATRTPQWALRVRPRTIGIQLDYHLK